MSDYIDYINSTLREVNIGEKVSPLHQQVFCSKSLEFSHFYWFKFHLEFKHWGKGVVSWKLFCADCFFSSYQISPKLKKRRAVEFTTEFFAHFQAFFEIFLFIVKNWRNFKETKESFHFQYVYNQHLFTSSSSTSFPPVFAKAS